MRRRPLLYLLLLLIALALAYQRGTGMGPQALAEIRSPVARVIDGDTFDLETGARVRLQGISAPERGETGGGAATKALRKKIAGQMLRCEDSGERSHGRVVARCYREEEDVGGWLVAQGLARDCPRHSGGYYAEWETAESRALPLPPYCRTR